MCPRRNKTRHMKCHEIFNIKLIDLHLLLYLFVYDDRDNQN